MSVVCVSTLGFVLFSGRYMAFRYMGYLIPLGQCLVILGAFRLLDSFPDGTGRLPALVLLGLMVLVPVRELFFRLQTIWHGHMDMFSHLKILADLSY